MYCTFCPANLGSEVILRSIHRVNCCPIILHLPWTPPPKKKNIWVSRPSFAEVLRIEFKQLKTCYSGREVHINILNRNYQETGFNVQIPIIP
jgi:hypothetical protein